MTKIVRVREIIAEVFSPVNEIYQPDGAVAFVYRNADFDVDELIERIKQLDVDVIDGHVSYPELWRGDHAIIVLDIAPKYSGSDNRDYISYAKSIISALLDLSIDPAKCIVSGPYNKRPNYDLVPESWGEHSKAFKIIVDTTGLNHGFVTLYEDCSGGEYIDIDDGVITFYTIDWSASGCI